MPYVNGSIECKLYIAESSHIFNQSKKYIVLLNSRSEIFCNCKHMDKFLLLDHPLGLSSCIADFTLHPLILHQLALWLYSQQEHHSLYFNFFSHFFFIFTLLLFASTSFFPLIFLVLLTRFVTRIDHVLRSCTLLKGTRSFINT